MLRLAAEPFVIIKMLEELKMKTDDKITKINFSEIMKGALPAAAVGFLLLVYAPVELYVTNVDGFIYDIYDLLRMMLPIFAAAVVLIICFFALLKKFGNRLFAAASAMFLWILTALYLQGTFFSKNLPPLDGREISWADYAGQRIPSLLIWGLSAAAVFLLLRGLGREKFLKISAGISGFVLVMLAVSAVMIAVPGEGLRDKRDLLVTEDHMLEMSEEENFVILLTDCIGGMDYDVLEAEHPEYEENLEDFTFFRNTVGVYPFTQFAVPYILCGEWYENDESFYTYKDRVYLNSPLLHELRERDYRLGVYEQDLPTAEAAVGDFENTVVSDSRKFNSPVNYVITQLKLVGLKYFPFDLKRFCLVAPDYLYANSLKKMDESGVYDWTNQAFYNAVSDGSIRTVDGKCFRYIHISGAHDPFIYDPEMNVVEHSCYEDCIEATLTCVNAYLDLLKSSGCYDNSTIIIMADHGYYDGMRQNPLLLIKGKGERHPYHVSEAPISYTDLQDAYVSLLDGSSAEEAFPWREGDTRDRRFLDYLFYSEDDMKEFIQHGYASDPETFEETGNRYTRQGEHITLHSFF